MVRYDMICYAPARNPVCLHNFIKNKDVAQVQNTKKKLKLVVRKLINTNFWYSTCQ